MVEVVEEFLIAYIKNKTEIPEDIIIRVLNAELDYLQLLGIID